MYRRTKTNMPQETNDVNCVAPPTASWQVDLEIQAEAGAHEKNEPTTLLVPCKIKKNNIVIFK